MLFTVATPTTGFVEQYPELVLGLLIALFGAVVFFVSAWMARHDKARDDMAAKLHEMDKQMVEIKSAHEFMKEAISDLKVSSSSILTLVTEMHRKISDRGDREER